MSIKRFRFNVTVVIHDPSKDVPEIRDPVTLQIVQHSQTGTRHVPPGEEVEVEESEGNLLIRRHGEYQPRPAVAAVEQPRAVRQSTFL